MKEAVNVAPALASDDIAVADDEGTIDLADFGDMCSQVESIQSSVALFQSINTGEGGSVGCRAVAFGPKFVVLDFPLSSRMQDSGGTKSSVADEELFLEGDSFGVSTVSGSNPPSGVVVFHIDNTTSMSRFDRMALTKRTLLRVIPNLLRRGSKVVVNAWASDPITRGRIQSHVVRVDEGTLKDDVKLQQYIEKEVFAILTCNGKTDLYGSFFQLLRQCKDDILRQGNVSSINLFVLTDGNHNHLDYPLHDPTSKNEDYFGVFVANLNDGKKFGRSTMDFSVEYCRSFSKKELASVYECISKTASLAPISFSCTFVGIGDADTESLSALVTTLGDDFSFYGITKVDHIETVFSNLSSGSKNTLKVTIGDNHEYTAQYSFESTGAGVNFVSGCGNFPDLSVAEMAHKNDLLVVSFGERSVELQRVEVDACLLASIFPRLSLSEARNHGSFGSSALADVKEALSSISSRLQRIPTIPYTVTAESFVPVFAQLQRDKKEIYSVKSDLFCRETRKIRQNPIFMALIVWMQELETLVSSQVESYRMNVEDELLAGMSGGDIGSFSKPSQQILDRLQHNLRNAGKTVHKINRLITSISSIRDRSMAFASKLLSSSLMLQYDSNKGLLLEVGNGSDSQHLSIEWPQNSTASAKNLLAFFNPASLFAGTIKSLPEPLGDMVSFPCILLRAKFDQYTIVFAPHLFTVQSVSTCPVSDSDSAPQSIIYCAEDVWDVCAAGHHSPGLPITSDSEYNMILPLAHTPLLFQLYLQRGRIFHSAVNITGDCFALTSATTQFAKFFYDSLLLLSQSQLSRHSIHMALCEQLLNSLISYQNCINCASLPPKKSSIEHILDDFPCVFPREDVLTGFSCPMGFATLLSLKSSHDSAPYWNILVRTLFSRMCEAISGHKVIRSSKPDPQSRPPVAGDAPSHDARKDLGDIEEEYRLLLGDLQTALRQRLQSDWIKLSFETKMEAVEGAGVGDILNILGKIVNQYFSRFRDYGLQSWESSLSVLARSVEISNFGLPRLCAALQDFEDLSFLHGKILDATLDGTVVLPIVYELCDSDNVPHLAIRNIHSSDLRDIVLYVDAIVATKASPKISYKPMLNPSFPLVASGGSVSVRNAQLNMKLNLELPVVNIAFIGNVNSGKSTIIGHMLSSLGIVPEQKINLLAAEAERVGLSNTTRYAWLVDRSAEERRRGVTIDSTFLGIQSSTRRFTFVDNPGHKDYLSNSIGGIFQADIVVMVTPASLPEIEHADTFISQVENQLVAACCFGIRDLIVAVNKMDASRYSQESFTEVCDKCTIQIRKSGFKLENVTFIPISALNGVNLVETDTSTMPWYTGACLMELFDSVNIPKRATEKPLRVPIDEIFKIPGAGTVLCGRVESGGISVGDRVSIAPVGITDAVVLSIETHNHSIQRAGPGDNIGVAIKCNKGSAISLKRGVMIEKPGSEIQTLFQKFEAQLFICEQSTSLFCITTFDLFIFYLFLL
jgi:elongation factor 1-alpha